jgi:Short C-terminal domain
MEGLMAARASRRMGARQQYRTMARMQRRRSSMQGAAGMRQDFEPAGQQQAPPPPPQAPAAAPEPQYMAELERLAQLRDQGVITPDDFDAKKRQLLGI